MYPSTKGDTENRKTDVLHYSHLPCIFFPFHESYLLSVVNFKFFLIAFGICSISLPYTKTKPSPDVEDATALGAARMGAKGVAQCHWGMTWDKFVL